MCLIVILILISYYASMNVGSIIFYYYYVFSHILCLVVFFDSVLCQYEYGSRNLYNLFLFPYYFTANASLVISITYYYEISSSLDVFSSVFFDSVLC